MTKKILIYNSGGGIGDSIQLFPLINSLKNLFEKSEIYYLSAHGNHFLGKLKEYNIKVKTLDLGLKYFGFRWWHLFVVKRNFSKLKIDQFDLIILFFGALGQTRTGTPKWARILSPLCLPCLLYTSPSPRDRG